MKSKLLGALALVAATLVSGCDINDADVVSRNLSTAAANFEVPRRIVFYNVRNGEFLLTIEGLCARDTSSASNEVQVTCQTGPNEYKKHFMGLTTEVTYFIEQTSSNPADKYHYRVSFKPSVIVPDIDLR